MTMPLLEAFNLEFQKETYLDRHHSKAITVKENERQLKITHNGSLMFTLSVFSADRMFPEASLTLMLLDGELMLMPSFSEISFGNNGLNITKDKQKSINAMNAFREAQNTRTVFLELIDSIMQKEASFIEFMRSRSALITELHKSE